MRVVVTGGGSPLAGGISAALAGRGHAVILTGRPGELTQLLPCRHCHFLPNPGSRGCTALISTDVLQCAAPHGCAVDMVPDFALSLCRCTAGGGCNRAHGRWDGQLGGVPSRRRACHFADAPSVSLLKPPPQRERGVQQNDSRDRRRLGVRAGRRRRHHAAAGRG